MKNIFTIAILITAMYSPAFSQNGWFWQNPYPTGNNLNCVSFVNSNTGYMTGGFGTVVKTTDKGNSWNVYYTPSNITIQSHYFTDENTGYCVGSSATGNIVKTTNGGINWNFQISSNGAFNLNCVYFTGPNTGYAGSTFGIIIKTTNGGSNWINLDLGTIFPIKSIYFTDENTGYAAVGELIYKTTNAGTNWVSQNTGITNILSSIYFVNNNTGFAAGENGRIIKTTNGGNNWNIQSTPSSATLNSINFTDENYGYAVSDAGLLRTSNSGVNWDFINPGFGGASIYMIDSDNAFTVGKNWRIGKTVNGVDWNLIYKNPNNNNNIYSIYFSSSDTGYAGSFRSILKTTNGGTNWNSLEINTGATMRSVYFTDNNNGYALSDSSIYSSKIFRTTNGGTNWESQNFFNEILLRSVYFPDPETGYIVGVRTFTGTGYLSKTTDSGNTWNELTTGSFTGLWSVYFTDSENGFASGDNGRVYITSNGGNSWIEKVISASKLNSVFFINPNTGFTAGDEGKIFKTTDNGNSWRVTYLYLFNSIYSIHFPDSLNGYSAGSLGGIFKTTNGGNNWIKSNPITDVPFSSIFFTSSNTGWTAGGSAGIGVILKTTDGGGIVGISQVSSNVPEKFQLKQNYPNPFNPNTIINYELRITNFVNLTVYDLLGHEVARLVNEKQSPGTYQVEFDGKGLPTGVYFYRFTAGEFTDVKRMMLIK